VKRFWCAILVVLALSAAGLTFGLRQVAADNSTWVTTWGASAVVAATGVTVADLTVRLNTHVSVGGSQVRIRISNSFSPSAVTIGHATVGTSTYSGSSAITSGTLQNLTFNGKTAITIPPGAQVLSDGVSFAVTPGQNLSVNLYLPGLIVNPSINYFSEATSYLSTPGDHTQETSGSSFPYPMNSYYFLSAIDVSGSPAVGSVVAVGDSITEGYGTTIDANQRWTDDLSVRLQSTSTIFGVVNEGIGGNQLLSDGGIAGVNGVARLDRDALAQSGVKDIILALGINDILFLANANQITTGYQQFVNQAHAVGLRAVGATITPFGGVVGVIGAMENTRQSVNASIRAGGIFDAYVDFDSAVRDPAHTTRLLPAYDSGDHIHPNSAGYVAMSNSINLLIF
jgi:lysophospholipase L1-like esterase